MKIVSYKRKSKQEPIRVGFMIDDDKVADMQESYRYYLKSENLHPSLIKKVPNDPLTFFRQGNKAIVEAKKGYTYVQSKLDKNLDFIYEKDKVTISTPIQEPRKIICVGRNYAEHAVEMKGDIPTYPVLFAKFSNALIGPEDSIEKNPLTEKLDYEVELAVVIGKKAANIARENANQYIAGYTISNDITARDIQKRTLQWLQGKTLDRSTPIGPWVVTPDEIKNPSELNIRSYVNGEKRQDGTTKDFIFNIPFLLQFISELITLEPGDIILTGTPEGVGAGMKPPQYLQVGDIITCEIENIGELTNKVIAKKNEVES